MMIMDAEMDIIKKWVTLHKLDLNVDELPENGKVIWKDSLPIAAGFLRECEGGVGILDSIITNPEASSNDRNIALDLLYEVFIDMAKNLFLTKLIGFTINENVIKRSQKFGFKETDYKLMIMSLGE